MVSLTSNVAVDYKRIHFLTPSQSSGDDIDNEEMLDALFPLEEQEVHMTLEEKAKLFDIHNQEARRLSIRLMNTTSEEEERRVLHKSLDLDTEPPNDDTRQPVSILLRVFALVFLLLLFLGCLVVLLVLGVMAVGPPKLPVGSYALVERQEGMEFFDYYTFYEGRDSVGSNGFNTYIGQQRAVELGILNVTMEKDVMDVFFGTQHRHLEKSNSLNSTLSNTHAANMTDQEIEDAIQLQNANVTGQNAHVKSDEQRLIDRDPQLKEEPFLYMSSSPTPQGPRESIRLEGKRRFNRGLFILDLRHMPAGCGVWPAFWLTDEANWPVNGEIDIVEGINYQSVAKTALHSTKTCLMDDVPMGVKTGTWDLSVGIPDKKTGIPDMTMRYATDCFVYSPHQWLNQGCVAVDLEGESLGIPLNQKGGGVYVLEWDPAFGHIRSWVFSPHTSVPENLRETIRTASEENPQLRVRPDPDLWPLPYGFFPIGDNTDCPANHFKNMRLVINLAFCGSVAGNRYQLDCPIQAMQFPTCNEWLRSEPAELAEAYWKIRGVYVFEREWERAWL